MIFDHRTYSCRRSRMGAAGSVPGCFITVIAVGAVHAMLMLASADTALAQGSTGGTLGKTDQELSGGVPKQQQEPPAARAQPSKSPTRAKPKEGAAGGCGSIAGSWTWSNGLSVAIGANGTAVASNGDSATWTCSGGMYVFTWKAFGNMTRMTLSSDGKQISGTGIIGPESAIRR